MKTKGTAATTIRMCGDGQVEGVATVLRQLDWLGAVKMSQREDGMINITALTQERTVATVAFVTSDGEVRWADQLAPEPTDPEEQLELEPED